MTEPIHILSLGAGVQSSTMALMAAAGEITPMPSRAIFADTGDEPKAVYKWLDWLRGKLPFPVEICQRSVLSDNLIEYGHSHIPAFTRGDNGKASLGRRQCTRHWKIDPVNREIRRVLSLQRKRLPTGHITVWVGISWDELGRMKESREPWIKHHWPLIDLRMTRRDCLAWMKAHGYPEPPKSACVYCPYQDAERWAAVKAAGGEDWELVRKVDGILAPRGEYLTADLKRIDEIDFLEAKRLKKEREAMQPSLFNNECEGMCGV